jgi:hypothetical protein
LGAFADKISETSGPAKAARRRNRRFTGVDRELFG